MKCSLCDGVALYYVKAEFFCKRHGKEAKDAATEASKREDIKAAYKERVYDGPGFRGHQ